MDNDLNQIYRQTAAIGRARFQERYANFVRAIQRLEEGIADYERLELDSIRDGVIQRFEFCAELAWKTVREYLLDQGYSGVNSPKSVMKLAYADGLLQEEQGWLALLNARNLTSHLYDEAAAQTVFEDVRAVYLPLLKDLVNRLR
ncbi:MAG: nucleotidyltransferase substrate binding protein [Clostridiales bacterium]|nr:nucleotidyltransferase substrate binding protein [Clostridiales bacterium]